MGIKIRKRKRSNDWWIFINHNSQRRAIMVGPSKKTAVTIAERIKERLILGDFDLKPNRKKQDVDYQIFLELKDANMALLKLQRTLRNLKQKEVPSGN